MPRKYTPDDLRQRGEQLYRERVAPRVGVASAGHYVLIDVDTGDFEVDADELAAAERLRERRPDAQVWFRRVGARHARRYGRRGVR